jgi:putative ABC transport system substrate-binding protein
VTTPRQVLIALGACALATSPIFGADQPMTIPRIGFLTGAYSCTGPVSSREAFRQGLNDLGYVEGRNIAVECRSADGNFDRLNDLAAELVRLKVDIIVAAGGELVARAAKHSSHTIPIVMTNVADPVQTGLVASLAHPGGNVTGLVTISPELSGKRLELLKQAFPKTLRVGVLTNPANPEQGPRMRELEAAAKALGVELLILEVRGPDDFNSAFSTLTKLNADALLPLGDPVIVSNQKQIVAFAAKNHLPAIYHRLEFVEGGGIMSYGPSYNDLFRRAAGYVDKILKGSKPGNLPIEQPTKFELVINLKTAKALGLTIPQSVLLRADEVIQ